MDKRMQFDIDADQIDIRPLLKKEFLELRIKAISSANPNVNNSWFTEESMVKSLQTFRNKPILGYFENNDFVSHNGQWNKDSETGIEFWDTYGSKGERILGLIRGDDDLEIVKDKNGLSWVCFSCAIWVQYNFRQVKRLLKDAKRAKKLGGPAKNVSVEVDLIDYEEMDNGVTKINEFNIVGVTILGSRNGVKVKPGIEGAGLSVIDVMGRELFEKQSNVLRVAYEKLDNIQEGKTMENNDAQPIQMNEAQGEGCLESQESEALKATTEEEKCPVCGENPCICENHCESQEGNSEAEEGSCGCEAKDDDPDEDDDNDEDNDDPDEEDEDEYSEAKQEEGCGEEHAEGAPCACESVNFAEQILTLSGEVTQLEAQLQDANNTIESLQQQIKQYEHKEFVSSAFQLITKANLNKDRFNEYMSKCESGEYSSLEVLKQDLAMEVFANLESKKENFEASTETSLDYAISTPQMPEAKAQKATKKDSWEILREYRSNN